MKLTKKDFEQFKKYCFEYQKKWGLTEWELNFEFTYLKDMHAQTMRSLESHQVTIALTNNWTDPITKFSSSELKSVAKHEMLHILVGALGELSQYRYLLVRELEAAEHELIIRLHNIIPN